MTIEKEIDKIYYRWEPVGIREVEKDNWNVFEMTNKDWEIIYSSRKRDFGRFLKKEEEHIVVIKK